MRPAATRSTAQHGFTLIEVLVATSLLVVGMTGVLAVGEVGPELLTPLAQRVVDQASAASPTNGLLRRS